MPSPKFTFRLNAQDRHSLIEVSKLYGAPSPGAFCAAMVSAVCSGDPGRIAEFNSRLIRGMGEQLALDFAAKAKEAQVFALTGPTARDAVPITQRKPAKGRGGRPNARKSR